MKKFITAIKECIKAHNTIVDTRTRYERRHGIYKYKKFIYIPKGF